MISCISSIEKEDMCTDICIIGSGIAGGTIVHKLIKSKIRFILIESGNLTNPKTPQVIYENIGRDFGLRSTTSIQVGGTSNLWHGVLAPLDSLDFEKREWIPNSGWPINLSDLGPYYKQASDILNINNYNLFNLDNLPKDLFDSLNLLNIDRRLFKNKIFQQPLPPINFKNEIVKYLKNAKFNHCFINTTALELKKKKGIIYKLKIGGLDGKFKYIKAKKYILCAGALETPRLLINSKFKNGNIGKYLMDHPMGNLCQVKFNYKTPAQISRNQVIKSGLIMDEDTQKKFNLPNSCFYFRPSFVRGINNESEKIKLSLLSIKDRQITKQDILKVIKNLNVVAQILIYKLSLSFNYKYADLFFLTEQTPNKESSVSLSNKLDMWGYPISRINWKVSDYDIESTKKWFEILKSNKIMNDHYSFTHDENDIDWENIFTSAAHHVGTARMGNTKITGVIDKNLKYFGMDNLYVCDGSAFPTSGNVNNGLTISALACRLVDYLKEANH